jgi:hypothetical protein
MPCHRAVGERTSQCRHCRHLPSLLTRLAKVSGDERPDGRLPACAWGDVAYGLNPYPLHYREAFASSILPFPHASRLALRLAFPKGKHTGFCHLTHKSATWAKICVTRVKWRRYASNSNWLKMDSRELSSHRLCRVTCLLSGPGAIEVHGAYWHQETETIPHRRRPRVCDRPRPTLARGSRVSKRSAWCEDAART